MEKVKVVFKKDRNYGDVVAIFPFMKWNFNCVTCYAHIGQHSGCALDYAYSQPLAKKSEYAELLAEIKRVYYNCEVEVLNKMPRYGEVVRTLRND